MHMFSDVGIGLLQSTLLFFGTGVSLFVIVMSAQSLLDWRIDDE